MLPRQSKVSATYSRTVLHGNKMNKRGFANAHSQLSSPNKISRKMRRMNFEETHSHHHFGDTVIKGKPPKPVCTEIRPTIPNCPNNSNIIEQAYSRATELHHDVMNEIKTRSKVISFATDFDHIEIV